MAAKIGINAMLNIEMLKNKCCRGFSVWLFFCLVVCLVGLSGCGFDALRHVSNDVDIALSGGKLKKISSEQAKRDVLAVAQEVVYAVPARIRFAGFQFESSSDDNVPPFRATWAGVLFPKEFYPEIKFVKVYADALRGKPGWSMDSGGFISHSPVIHKGDIHVSFQQNADAVSIEILGPAFVYEDLQKVPIDFDDNDVPIGPLEGVVLTDTYHVEKYVDPHAGNDQHRK